VAEVEVTVRDAEIGALADDPAMRTYLLEVGGEVASYAAAGAPKRSGAGAAAIRAELDGTDVVVGVDQLHAYMRFQDAGYQHSGTAGRFHPGRHFTDQALDRYARP
jgi:hypothetical protein